MFKKMQFCFDRFGKLLEIPTELKLAHCNAKVFNLQSRSLYQMPAVMVVRVYPSVKNDPYEDGNRTPPTSITTIVNPHFEFMEDMLIIDGLERASLCWAGFMKLPINGKPLSGVNYLPNDDADLAIQPPFNYDTLCRQRIRLIT